MLGAFTGCSNDTTVVRAASPAPYYYPYDYYYPDCTDWIKVRVLPSRLYLDTRDRVTVKIKSNDRLYIYHNVHRQRYVPHPKYRVDRRRDRTERNLNRDRYKRFQKR